MENLADDHYEFIGVKRDASTDDIKKACNKLLMKYHPDVCKEDFAAGITTHINKIKAILTDPNERAAYDRTLSPTSQKASSKPKTKEPLDLSGYIQVKWKDLSPFAKKQYKKFKASGEPGYKVFSGMAYKYIILCTKPGNYEFYRKRELVYDSKYSY